MAAATVSNPGNKQLLGSLRRAAKPPEIHKHFVRKSFCTSTVQNVLVDNVKISKKADNNGRQENSRAWNCES
jgi:hypothetical protein